MAQIEINEARIRAEFGELARIDSESFGEREMADRLKEKLAELGIQAKEDDTAEKIGGNAGNLFGTLKGGMSGTPILLSGHMDTVAPGIGKKPVFHEDGTITSDGTTVLGADDLTGVIAILEGIRAVCRRQESRTGISRSSLRRRKSRLQEEARSSISAR